MGKISLQCYLHFIVVGDNNREQKVPPGSYIFCRSKATKLHFQNLSYHVQNTCSGTEFGIGNFMDIFKDNLGSVPAVLVAPKPGVFAQTSGRLQRNTEVF